MLNEEVKKKLGLIILASVLVLGAIFVFFAVFLNRGSLTVVARAPYSLNIWNLTTVACSQDVCSTTLAPGEYSVTAVKPGYGDERFGANVPILGEDRREINFMFLPQLGEITSESAENLFPEPQLNDRTLADKLIFIDQSGQYLSYLDYDPELKRQALFLQPNEENGSASRKAVTSFVRSLENYLIFPGIDKHNKIAVVEKSASGSTLYLVDLAAKTRISLFSYPLIKDVLWLPDGRNFLFLARDNGDVSESVFFYDLEKKQAEKLDLKTGLKNIAVLNDSTLIAATSQNVSFMSEAETARGRIVLLGEKNSDSAAPAGTGFIEYDLPSRTARWIASETERPASEAIKLNEDRSGIYFRAGGKVYELIFNK